MVAALPCPRRPMFRLSNPATRRRTIAVLLAGAASLVQPAHAGDPFDTLNLTAGELARLPEYCPHTWGYHPRWGNMAEREAWFARLGFMMSHMHHYCWGILKFNRANGIGATPQLRNSLLGSAINESHYVIDRAPNGFVLLPEFLYRVGTYHAALDQWVEAIDYFDRARAAKPDYWPPYLETANLNLRIGRRQHAVEVLRAGLEIMPEESRLREALSRIESKPTPVRGRSPTGSP